MTVLDNKNTAQPGGGGYRWVILALLTVAQLVMSIAAYSWGPLAPFLRAEFGVTRGQVGALVSSLFLVSAVVSIPSGVAVDRWGGRVMLIMALTVMGLSFAALYLAHFFPVLLFIVALSGTGYGMINQISTKGLILWFNSKSRAMALGIKQTGVTLGGAVGAVMIPAVSASHGWRWAVVLAGILMLTVAGAVVCGYRDHPTEPPDPVGPSPAEKSRGWRGDLRSLWTKRELLTVSAVGILMSFSQTSITSFWVLYLQEELGFSMWKAGACLTVLMAAGAAGRVIWGIISDRVFYGDRQKPMVLLCLAAFAGALGAALFTGKSSGWIIYCLSALLGFTFMGWNAVFLTLCAEIAGPALAGSATGLMLMAVSAGVVIGPPLFGIIADSAGYFWGWLILSLFGLAGAFSFARSVRRSLRVCHEFPVDPRWRK